MCRSSYKRRIYFHRKVYNLSRKLPLLKKKSTETLILKIYKKGSSIPMAMVGKSVFIHDGLVLQKVQINSNMVHFKFGQFVFTKRIGAYIHKDNKLVRKKAKKMKQLAAQASARRSKKKKKEKKKK